MDYNSILSALEEQRKNEELSAKLYRYTGLIHAIEFFSQKLSMDQIIDSAFDFVNELLLLERSVVFVLQGSNYVPKKIKGYYDTVVPIKNNDNLQNLAILYGTLIHDTVQLEKYFDKSIIASYGVTTVIPLIIENSLFGFIFISSKTAGEMHSDDYIISEALMRLFNNALEYYKRYEELQEANKELDEKVFNLFAINQSSKALLSELNMEVLYNLSVDVFSELTQSAVTGFFLYDDKSETYMLKSFKDIFHSDKELYLGLSQRKLARIDINRLIVHLKNAADVAYFNSLFIEQADILDALQAQYVVFLIKNGRILGFVTLANTVTGMEYRKSIFELIESLASATYIALSNAQLFKQVNEQKKIIQSKLDRVVSLNVLMKNINSSLTMDTLLELTAKTMEISFDVEKGIVAVYNKEKDVFSIARTVGIETKKKEIRANAHWKRVFEGDTIFEATEENVGRLIHAALMEDIGVCPGVVISPIFVDRIDIEMLGVIIILKYRNAQIEDEENLLTIETIAGHLAPVMSNLSTLEEQKRFHLPNYTELFKRDLKNRLEEAMECSLTLEVFQLTDPRDYIFQENPIVHKLKGKYELLYPLSNNNIFIINEKEDNTDKKLRRIIGDEPVEIKKYQLGKDFCSYQEFFALF